MSNVYLARPVTLSGPSTRLTDVPSTVRVVGQANFGSLAPEARRRVHHPEGVPVADRRRVRPAEVEAPGARRRVLAGPEVR